MRSDEIWFHRWWGWLMAASNNQIWRQVQEEVSLMARYHEIFNRIEEEVSGGCDTFELESVASLELFHRYRKELALQKTYIDDRGISITCIRCMWLSNILSCTFHRSPNSQVLPKPLASHSVLATTSPFTIVNTSSSGRAGLEVFRGFEKLWRW